MFADISIILFNYTIKSLKIAISNEMIFLFDAFLIVFADEIKLLLFVASFV